MMQKVRGLVYFGDCVTVVVGPCKVTGEDNFRFLIGNCFNPDIINKLFVDLDKSVLIHYDKVSA